MVSSQNRQRSFSGVFSCSNLCWALVLPRYRRAAERGFAKAQNNLGSLYHTGKGMPLSHRLAIEWCEPNVHYVLLHDLLIFQTSQGFGQFIGILEWRLYSREGLW